MPKRARNRRLRWLADTKPQRSHARAGARPPARQRMAGQLAEGPAEGPVEPAPGDVAGDAALSGELPVESGARHPEGAAQAFHAEVEVVQVALDTAAHGGLARVLAGRLAQDQPAQQPAEPRRQGGRLRLPDMWKLPGEVENGVAEEPAGRRSERERDVRRMAGGVTADRIMGNGYAEDTRALDDLAHRARKVSDVDIARHGSVWRLAQHPHRTAAAVDPQPEVAAILGPQVVGVAMVVLGLGRRLVDDQVVEQPGGERRGLVGRAVCNRAHDRAHVADRALVFALGIEAVLPGDSEAVEPHHLERLVEAVLAVVQSLHWHR